MSRFVLDCSIAAAWCFEDEATAATDQLLDSLRHHGAVVPSLWLQEVSNVLMLAERHGRIPPGRLEDYLNLLRRLPLEVVPADSDSAFGRVVQIAQSERLTSYDATYLELALREQLPLATLDKALIKAAHRIGVTVLPDKPA